MNFQFPISKEDGSAYTTEELFDLLAKELTGHYLLGNYNYWHGGIHFSDATVAYCKDKQPIHCIADGQIIAYRINDNYCRSEYIPDRNNSSSDNNLSLFYSNSFCLVKHDYTSPTKEPPKKEAPSKAQQWVGRYFRLSTERNIRDKSTTNDKECDFTGKLPKDSQIQILEMAEPKGDYTIAKVKIIAIAGNQAINNTNPNKNATTKEITKNVGDEVYIAAFDKEANIKIINNSPLLTEYTPAATLVNQTVKLNTVTVAKVTLINTNQILLERINNLRTLNLFNKRDNNTTIPFSSTTTQSDNRDQLTYEAKLPQGTQVQIITIQETQANVKLTRPVTAQLVTSNVTEVDKWLQLQAGDIVTITLYQNNQQILATYKATTSAQTAPILETTSPASSWDGQMIILDKDTPATDDKEYSHGVKFQLPAGTKLQVQNTVAQNRETHYTIAKLLHDVKVVAIDGYQRTLLEGSIIKVDIFDYFGNLENPITKTDNPAPLKNTLTFYSLYMHLLPSEEYTSEQKLPSYWQGKIIAKVTANGLQTYADDAARTSGAIIKGAIIKADGIFEYNPKDTLQHTVTNTATKKTETLTLTRCTFKTGGFKTNTTLNTNESFLAVIEEKTSKPIKAIPDNPNQVNLCIPPIAIKAGDTIGYLGLYETPKPPLSLVQSSDQSRPNPSMETNSKSQLHLEIFALDKRELTQFIENKAKLDTGKEYLKLLVGAVLQATISLPTPDGNAKPQVNQQPAATTAFTTHTLNKEHILELDKVKLETDSNNKQWYKIEVTEQSTLAGYIETDSKQTKLLNQHDWQELGFTIIEEDNPFNDGFLDKDEMSKFFQDLYDEIDEDKKDGVTQKELQAALKNQDLRDRWTKLIGYHPTEWQASSDDSKWSRLNTILGSNEELLRHEKERIDKLRFWDDVPELAIQKQAYHFHPIQFINNMLGEIITEITVEYHIYYNGTIKYKLLDVTNSNEKRTDQELINERKVAKYIYYDKNNNKHKLGSYHIEVVNNLYRDSYYKDRLGGNKIYLMDMRNKTSYFRKIDGLEVKFKMNINTVRYYANDITAASLLGAMLNTGYIDFTYNGSSNEKGQSIGGSISHKNGINLDMRYLRTDQTGKKVQLNLNNKEDDPCGWKGLDVERENKFLDELTRFGWKDKLSWKYWIENPTKAEWQLWYNEWKKNNPNVEELPVLKNITHNNNHYDHLHLQEYSPILEKINK